MEGFSKGGRHFKAQIFRIPLLSNLWELLVFLNAKQISLYYQIWTLHNHSIAHMEMMIFANTKNHKACL